MFRSDNSHSVVSTSHIVHCWDREQWYYTPVCMNHCLHNYAKQSLYTRVSHCTTKSHTHCTTHSHCTLVSVIVPLSHTFIVPPSHCTLVSVIVQPCHTLTVLLCITVPPKLNNCLSHDVNYYFIYEFITALYTELIFVL